ncbi:DUF3108 domain-containing protein [Isoalcanivorax pacificus]|uniref:DUF3108 domain-containing protein n=1 Tax=Isoalcanivorax pacificus TaxID=1306787 RepID=UPI001EE69AFB|nr:DUF3108 domain-containing protein [Isoalcanivorax pacificus]
MRRAMFLRGLITACVFSLWPVAAAADTVDTDDDALQPFRVEYRINVSRIPTTIKADMSLEAGEDDTYRMQLSIDSMLMKNTELSIFRWLDCAPRTMHYMHTFRGFRRERDYQMDFFWDPPRVSATTRSDDDGEESVDYDIPSDTLDELTMLLKARCVINDEQTDYQVTTAYGKRLRTHYIHVVGRETLDTPLGKLDTIRIEKRRDQDSKRRTVFWLAPELDYLLVRARHIESAALFGELRMSDYEGPFDYLKDR